MLKYFWANFLSNVRLFWVLKRLGVGRLFTHCPGRSPRDEMIHHQNVSSETKVWNKNERTQMWTPQYMRRPLPSENFDHRSCLCSAMRASLGSGSGWGLQWSWPWREVAVSFFYGSDIFQQYFPIFSSNIFQQ